MEVVFGVEIQQIGVKITIDADCLNNHGIGRIGGNLGRLKVPVSHVASN